MLIPVILVGAAIGGIYLFLNKNPQTAKKIKSDVRYAYDEVKKAAEEKLGKSKRKSRK